MKKSIARGINPQKKSNWGKVITPVNFDLDEHLRNHPPFEGFEARKMLYIMSLVYLIPSWNSDDISEDGFVPISTDKLSRRIRGYKRYIDYLLDTGVFVTDGSYVVGSKCRGFKYSGLYSNSEPNGILIDNPVPYITGEQFMQQKRHELDAKYLYHWYNQGKLKIDYHLAVKCAYNMKEARFEQGYETWSYNVKTRKKKYPRSQYNAALVNIGALVAHDYNVHKDNNVHRLHSRLTNLQKELRNFITYDGQKMVSIDIKNSQPYLANVLFNQDY